MEDLLIKPAVGNSHHCRLALPAAPAVVFEAIVNVKAWWSIYTSGDAAGADKEWTGTTALFALAGSARQAILYHSLGHPTAFVKRS